MSESSENEHQHYDNFKQAKELASLTSEVQATYPIVDQVQDARSIDEIRESIIRTDRNAVHYEKVFGPENLAKSPRILDLAAGDSNFAEVYSQQGIDVVRLDATYGVDRPSFTEAAVAGRAEQLPFRDDSFNKVVTSFLLEQCY